MKTPKTDYERYRSMKWTSDHDECENACGQIMGPLAYIEGAMGHYCSKACHIDAECLDVPSHASEAQAERRAMGIE